MCRWVIILTLFLMGAGLGCAPPDAEAPSEPFFVRILCKLQQWLEREDFRIYEEGVDRCSGAAQQIEEGQERVRELLQDETEPTD